MTKDHCYKKETLKGIFMKQKKIMVSLVLIMLLVIGGFGYMVYKQDAEKEKMIAIAHSEEAKKSMNHS
ncbi:hypothetical protein ABG808_07885 [Streptococcus iniae]